MLIRKRMNLSKPRKVSQKLRFALRIKLANDGLTVGIDLDADCNNLLASKAARSRHGARSRGAFAQSGKRSSAIDHARQGPRGIARGGVGQRGACAATGF